MRIQPVVEELPAEFDQLRAEARAERHYFLDRLASDWAAGAMPFSRPGEKLLAAYSDDVLAGVGGITRDPVIAEALRMRRFYVRANFRRTSIGRTFAHMLLEQAFRTVEIVVVNAAPDSVRFWESLGFLPDARDGHTHILHRRNRAARDE